MQFVDRWDKLTRMTGFIFPEIEWEAHMKITVDEQNRVNILANQSALRLLAKYLIRLAQPDYLEKNHLHLDPSLPPLDEKSMGIVLMRDDDFIHPMHGSSTPENVIAKWRNYIE